MYLISSKLITVFAVGMLYMIEKLFKFSIHLFRSFCYWEFLKISFSNDCVLNFAKNTVYRLIDG